MDAAQASKKFLREVAAKHFVCLTYEIRRTGESESKWDYASCFIIQMDQQWFLVTAGHIISKIREYKDTGASLSTFRLQDKLAGNEFPYGVPISISPDDWIAFDDKPQGSDYALALINEFFVRTLVAGGIEPLPESSWGIGDMNEYDHCLLTGIPSESHQTRGKKHKLSLTILPILPSPPPGVVEKVESEFQIFAKILDQPGLDSITVNDVKGMSGCPVFGIRNEGDSYRYWLIGLQSSWYSESRVVCFCPVHRFFAAVKHAIQVSVA